MNWKFSCKTEAGKEIDLGNYAGTYQAANVELLKRTKEWAKKNKQIVKDAELEPADGEEN